MWGELGAASSSAGVAPITASRRDLQRDHVNRLAASLVVPSASRADPRGLLRVQARSLLNRLEATQRSLRPGTDAATRAHLADSAETLRQAFAASMLRLAL